MKTIVWFGLVLGAVSVSGTVVYTQSNAKVTLDCGVKSISRHLVWHHGGEMVISMDSRGFQRKGSSSVASRVRVKQDTKLEISGVREEDAGTFTCDADGIKHEHTLAVVSVSANPPGELELGSSVTLQCRVNGLTPTVQWTRPDGTRAAGTVSGTVELKPVGSSDAGTWKCSINPDGGTYALDLKVKEQTPVTTAPSPTQSSEDSVKPACTNCDTKFLRNIAELHWWVWVAVGVGGLVIVLLMVVVIVMCKRIRRKKRRLMKNSHQQLRRPKQYCQCNRPTAAARPQQGRRKEKPSTLHMQPLLTE